MTYRFLCLGILSLAAGAMAQPADFVRGRVVNALEGESVLRVIVPPDVYEWITRWDLGDVRVLDAAGGEVPYRIRRPQSREEFSDWVELPVFSLPVREAEPGQGARVDIQLDDGGAVVAVNGVVPGVTKPGAYLLDASKYELWFSELRLGWSAGPDGFVGKFRLEASDDLNTWRSIAESSTLADLTAGGGKVVVDRIAVDPTKARYLRLTQLEGNEPIHLDALAVRSRQAQLPARNWKTLTAEAVKDGFEFYSEGLFPLDRLAVELDTDSYLVVANVFSRARPKDPWRRHGKHTFYKTSVDGSVVTSRGVPSRSQHQYWRVELETETVGVPRLRVGWRPDEIVFLNQAPGPLLLVYGRAGLEGQQWPLQELLAQVDAGPNLDALAMASLNSPTTLGGPDMLDPVAHPIDWQTVLLWSVLLLGVGVVGGLAYRLVKASS